MGKRRNDSKCKYNFVDVSAAITKLWIELGGLESGFYYSFSVSDTTKKPGFNLQFCEYLLSIDVALRYALANGMNEKANYLQAEKDRILLALLSQTQTRKD